MNTTVSGPAFSATVAGKQITGKVAWAEGNTVLVFSPTKPSRPGRSSG